MQDEKYSIDGEWPKFQSRFDLHTWVSRQFDIKAGRFAPHDLKETCSSDEMPQSEAAQVVSG